MDQRLGQVEWVTRWKAAAPRLAAIRADELRRVDVPAFIASMDDAFEAARVATPATSSGLITQQRLFARLHG